MLNANYNEVMGNITIKQGKNKFTLDICHCNALASFIYHYTDKDNQRFTTLYTFFADIQHCKNIIKHNGMLFNDEVLNISLNLFYKESKSLLTLLVKNGYKVNCYYTAPESK